MRKHGIIHVYANKSGNTLSKTKEDKGMHDKHVKDVINLFKLHLYIIVKRVIKNNKRTKKEQCDKWMKRRRFQFFHFF